MTSQIRAPYNN